MVLGYQSLATSTTPVTASVLIVPRNAAFAKLQAISQVVRYTLDGSAPSTTVGMRLNTGIAPEAVPIEDLKRIQFCCEASTGLLNIEYHGGRQI